MPNNENNNLDNNLPTPEQMPQTNQNNNEEKAIIEIPQEYYDKIEQEKNDQLQKEQEIKNNSLLNNFDFSKNSSVKGIGPKIIINFIIIAACLYTAMNLEEIILLGIPIVIVLGSVVFAIKEKKDSTYPTAALLAGMILAVITFAGSMVMESQSEILSHYALLSAGAGFLGLIVGGIITNIIANREEVKAVGTLGSIIILGALVAIPYFAYQKYPEVISRFLFMKQVEVKADNEDEFIQRTLKNRYGMNISCDNNKVAHSINQKSQRVTNRTCTAEGTNFNVTSIAYNEGNNQYIVLDELMDIVYLNDVRQKISEEIKNTIGATKVDFFLYPKESCTFIGDCADCDEYYSRYNKESDKTLQYKASTELNFSKYLNKKAIDFVNEYEFKYIIQISGAFNLNYDYSTVIQTILKILDEQGLKNTYGFNISLLFYSKTEDLAKEIYKVKGNTNSNKEFKDFEVLPIDGNKNNK